MSKISILLAAVMAAMLPFSIAAASGTNESGSTEQSLLPHSIISVEYSKGISWQTGDQFNLVCMDKISKEEKKVQIDVQEEGNAYITLPEGEYTVKDIDYTGYNNDIEKQGYAVTSDFSTSADGGIMVHVGVGEKAVSKLKYSYQSVLHKKDGGIVSDRADEIVSETDDCESNTEAESGEISTGSMQESASEKAESMTVDETEPTIPENRVDDNYEPTVVDYQSEKEDGEPQSLFGSWLSKLAFLLFIALISGIGGYLIYKQGD